MKPAVSIFWFRRDLRLDDNHGLYQSLKSGHPVIPIFIFDTNILATLPENDARVFFIHETISKLNQTLGSKGLGSIQTFNDTPLNVFQRLANEFDIQGVFTNHDYEPYARERDTEIENWLVDQSIAFHTFKDQVIFEKSEVVKDNGDPYVVYTPFMKKWKSTYRSQNTESYPSEELLDSVYRDKLKNQLSLSDIGFSEPDNKIAPYCLNPELIQNYEATRNFPAIKGTSRLGPHLRFGTVSIRKIVKRAVKEANEIFWQELIWREFFMQILWHFPHTKDKSFKPKYDRIPWRVDPEAFKAWCGGRTGYPLVDAGMRELNQTGFMHNRVRMLVGSFLCKHLLIDWRLGEAYFALKLHDYEMASNVGNWQWVAGCGVDAAPYFRIFNPTTQIQKFDKKLEYIKAWVPEFQELTYPAPIVDHKFARERCLSTYKEALQ